MPQSPAATPVNAPATGANNIPDVGTYGPVPPGFGVPGGGGVDSVNTKTGVVVLAASDVGADAAGAATTAVSGIPNDGAAGTPSLRTLGTGATQAAAGSALAAKADTTDPRFTQVAGNAQTGTTYTLVLADAGKAVECSNASPVTLTVPLNAAVAFPIGTVVEVAQTGAGVVTVTPTAGVTIRSLSSKVAIAGQYGTARLRKRGTDEWVLAGALA